MASGEMLLFQKALWEASANVYERELAECEQNAKCSRRHYAKMRKIIGVAVLPATSRKMQIKRRIIAALIAAVLLLTGCTTYAYREEIREFIETVFEDYIRVTYHDGEDPAAMATIEEYYMLGYVPEGYELVDELEQPTQTKYKWVNSKGDYIVFRQFNVDSMMFVMDTETAEMDLIKIGERSIYCRRTNVNYYIWNDGKYAYQLTISFGPSEQELILIIEGLKIK